MVHIYNGSSPNPKPTINPTIILSTIKAGMYLG